MAHRLNTFRRTAVLIALLALVGGAVTLLLLGGDRDSDSGSAGHPGPSSRADRTGDYRFSLLSSAESNRCDLGAGELRRMRDETRLQGSCCFPMDQARYQEQLRDLRRYRRSSVIPRDPYDVRAAMAKRLLDYRQIALDRGEQAAYEHATELSDQGGPCCCPCWRWQAFKGQAHLLLARRGWSAGQVARMWDLEEGCGGPGEHA
ncbi:MAG: hypothetical protein ACRDLO_16245 [Solirubrobacterales bacterium]